MRPDQLERLAAIQDRLVEALIVEADPDNWPGAGVPPMEMSRDERGDRFWCKRNAAQTFVLLERSQSVLTDAAELLGKRKEQVTANDIDREIDRQEKRAADLLDKVMQRAKAASTGKG